MDRLKKGRRPIRSQITKLINSVETALKKPVEELDKTDLRVSALQLEDLCQDLHEWDERITEAMIREELEKVLNPKKGVSPLPDVRSLYTRSSTSRRRVLLPKRKIPEFGGDVREWITFRSRFEDIHNDEDLSESDKLHVGKFRSSPLVLSYPVSEKNYASVIKDLNERFGRDNMLIKVYVRDLFAQEKKVNFKDLVTKLHSQFIHLSMLGVTTDRCADILYLVVESCLPQDVLISWQRSSQSEDLESLMKLLRREVNQTKDREMAYNKHSDSLAQPTPGKIEMKKRSFNARREIATTSGFMHSDISPTMHEKLKCIFCHNCHPSQDCQKGMKMEWTRKMIKSKSTRDVSNVYFRAREAGNAKGKCALISARGMGIMPSCVDHAESERNRFKSPE
ncbi:hypothetical protein LAZ67_10002330 [Cordylochernes scorpioides]|uniref:Uncharacterized protein n=1 Tax=Cordylochernes scorpioides TaxID=51811 RepID=A0ABY6KYU6_9ARAC|nr:hypothetical protein LAZ67_10002330 [Cordylochernes scorpioides]